MLLSNRKFANKTYVLDIFVAQIQEDIRDRNNDGHNHQGVDIPQLCVVSVLLAPSIVAGGVPLLHPGSGVVVGLGSHTL